MLKDFSKEKFDIIIQAGQSNSEGSGIGEATEPFTPNDQIWFLNNNFTISQATERINGNQIVGGLHLSFANEYVKNGNLHEGRKLLILRAAVGGTGFVDKRWGLQDDLFLQMIEMTKTALSLNPENKLLVLLWHQGETDSTGTTDTQLHYKNLSALLETVRNTFNRHDLPFIAADFVQHWKNDNLEVCVPVEKAIRKVCQTFDYARFVETDQLESNSQKNGGGDAIHFCREALYTLGRRYYDAFIDICQSGK